MSYLSVSEKQLDADPSTWYVQVDTDGGVFCVFFDGDINCFTSYMKDLGVTQDDIDYHIKSLKNVRLNP